MRAQVLENGNIGGADRLVWNPTTDPYGMVFIPQGSFVMGPSDQDVPFECFYQPESFCRCVLYG